MPSSSRTEPTRDQLAQEYAKALVIIDGLRASRDVLLDAAESTLEYWELTGFAECDEDCDCIVDMTRAAIAQARGRCDAR